MRYILLDELTGIIIKQGICQDSDAELILETNPGTVLLESSAVVDDTVHVYDFAAGRFVESVSLAAAKEIAAEARIQKQIKAQRNALLAASDWTQLQDVHLQNIKAWQTYRQALRDLDLVNKEAKWPIPPEVIHADKN